MHLILKDSRIDKEVGTAEARSLLLNQVRTKKSGLAAVTLISAPNPVSQVLW